MGDVKDIRPAADFIEEILALVPEIQPEARRFSRGLDQDEVVNETLVTCAKEGRNWNRAKYGTLKLYVLSVMSSVSSHMRLAKGLEAKRSSKTETDDMPGKPKSPVEVVRDEIRYEELHRRVREAISDDPKAVRMYDDGDGTVIPAKVQAEKYGITKERVKLIRDRIRENIRRIARLLDDEEAA